MKLVYVDESGDLGVTPASLTKDKWFVLGALCIDDSARPVAHDMVMRLKRQFFPRFDPNSPETEIKGATLHHFERITQAHPQRSPAKNLMSHALAPLDAKSVQAFRRSVFDIINRIDCCLYVVAVDKDRLTKRLAPRQFGPLSYAFTYISQRVLQMLEFDGARREQALMFLDRHTEIATPTKMAKLLSDREQLHSRATWSPAFEPLLFEQPVILDSHLQPLVQLADLCTWTVGNAIRTENMNHPWFKQIEHRLALNWGTKEYWAAGVTLYPKSAYPGKVRAALRRP